MSQLNRRKGVLVTTAGIVLISPDSLILRVVGGDPFTLLFARCGFACLTLIVLSLLLNRSQGIKQLYQLTRAEWFIAVMFSLSTILFVFAVMNTTVANTFVISSVGPLFGAILSRFFLGELVARRTWVAILIIIIGLSIIFSESLKSGGLAGDCAALLGAIGMSAIFVVIRKHPEISMLPALAWSCVVVAIMAFPKAQLSLLTINDWGLLLLLGLFILPVAQALMTLGPRYITAPEVSLIQRIEALLAPLWVWLVLGEVPSKSTLQGGILILVTLVGLAAWAMREEKRVVVT